MDSSRQGSSIQDATDIIIFLHAYGVQIILKNSIDEVQPIRVILIMCVPRISLGVLRYYRLAPIFR